MTGGLGQRGRVMAHVDREYREGLNLAPTAAAARPAELLLAPGEDLQRELEVDRQRAKPLPNAAWFAFAFALAALAAHHAWWSAAL